MNIYISHLSYGVDDNGLKEVFEAYGQVDSAKVITDKFTGKSRGFGFVEMPDEAEANKAIEALNQSEVNGMTINVNIAKPREERPRREFSNNGGGRGGYSDRRNNNRW
ncbi:MAG: RNA-binding protein [Bacteroidetes bacterium]|jgi:RNA recognition motif-containing protein|nr:RNA-binding protein [Bacteroidota bacterium]